MQIFAKTDIGKVRDINQDAFYINTLSDGSALAIVCDGMGGAVAGDVASKTAVDVISQYMINSYSPSMDSEEIIKLMNNAVISANIEIYDLSCKDERLSGMGTTVVMAVVCENRALICNVGDSRAYLTDDKLNQITRDHSVVQSLVESGKLSPEQAKVHPEKNVITRALGVEADVLTDSYTVDFNKNSKILLCTDGMSNYVPEEEIFNIVKNNNIDTVTDLLIEKANQGGGKDNITVAVVSY